MVKIVATQNLPYGKNRIAAGEEFDASEKDARLLIKIGRAAHVRPLHNPAPTLDAMDAPAPAAPAGPQTKEAAQDAPAHPQTYQRRDMVAEPRAGPTGQAKPSPSSRRAPARKAKR
jgi:hypothetical protein